MKIKISIIIALLPLFAAAQTPGFTISGKIGNLNAPAKIHLDYTDNGAGHTDSAILVNGSFSFSGHADDISTARISLDHTGRFGCSACAGDH